MENPKPGVICGNVLLKNFYNCVNEKMWTFLELENIFLNIFYFCDDQIHDLRRLKMIFKSSHYYYVHWGTLYDRHHVQFTYFLRVYSHVLISGFLCLLLIHPSQLFKLGLQPVNIVYCISLDPDLIKPQPASSLDPDLMKPKLLSFLDPDPMEPQRLSFHNPDPMEPKLLSSLDPVPMKPKLFQLPGSGSIWTTAFELPGSGSKWENIMYNLFLKQKLKYC